MITTRAALLDRHKDYKKAWEDANQNGPVPRPSQRTAAHAFAVQRCRKATEQRGIWP